MEEAQTTLQPPASSTYQVKFDGKAFEYFGIWIVNICLTILTLGIYSAWAKVRTNRYFYGNTTLDGSAFEYLADPKTILKGRVFAVILFAVYSGVGNINPQASFYAFLGLVMIIPSIVVLSMSFRMRNTGYRGLTFHFQRNFKASYLVFGLPFLFFGLVIGGMIMTLPEVDPATGEFDPVAAESFMSTLMYMACVLMAGFMLFPVWDKLKSHFVVTNTGYGKSRFELNTTVGAFYRIYLAAFLVLIIGTLAYALAFSLVHVSGEVSDQGGVAEWFAGLYSIFLIPLYLYIFAYIQAYRHNLIFNQSRLDSVRMRSELTASYLFYLYITNTVAIVLSVGLLIPWAQIRTARYRAHCVTVVSRQPLSQFVRQQENLRSAVGEEVGEVFDMDIGL